MGKLYKPTKKNKKRNKKRMDISPPETVTPKNTVDASIPEEVVAQATHESEPPYDFVCPITQEPMVDPVVIADGHTYERGAIEEWMRRNATSPKTGQRLDYNVIFPNHNLRLQIIEWRERHSKG